MAAVFTGCAVQIFGSDDTITIDGDVVSNGPVAGATVSIVTGATSESVTTDSTGKFRLTFRPDSDRVKVNVEAARFAPTIAVVTRRVGVFRYYLQVVLTAPTRLTMPMTSDAGMQQMKLSAGGQDITIEVPPGVVPPGATLEVTAFDPANGPGTMETTEGADSLLQTGGMLHVRVVDSAGQEVKMSGGQGIGITPGDMTNIGEVGMTQAYALNDEAVWSPETATSSNAMGKALRAQQAGFWNCDRRYRTSCVRGRIESSNKSCGGQKVTAGGQTARGLFSQDTSGATGEFCLEGPQGLFRTLSVGSTTKVISFPRAAGSCRINPGACLDIGVIGVRDDDCPGSCANDETDTPSGCQKKPTPPPPPPGGTGGGGGTDSGGGFTCSGTKQCSAWQEGSAGGGCQWRSCACLDVAGMCGRGWYETNAGQVFTCGPCSAACTSAAMALIASCK